MGDFNIWIDDRNNKDLNTYLRAMESLGLEQHVTFSTHNKRHKLDHMFTESGSKMIVDCISDHRSVMAEVNTPKENILKVTRTQRKLKNLNIEELCNNMDFTCVTNSVDSVDECVKLMEGEVKRSLDIVAPVKTFTMVVRQKRMV